MSPEFQRRFESLMEMVPKAEEKDGSDDDDLYTADQVLNTRRSILHTSCHVRSRNDPLAHSGSGMHAEMRDSSQDPTLDNSSAPPASEGPPFDFGSLAAFMNANPPLPTTPDSHPDKPSLLNDLGTSLSLLRNIPTTAQPTEESPSCQSGIPSSFLGRSEAILTVEGDLKPSQTCPSRSIDFICWPNSDKSVFRST